MDSDFVPESEDLTSPIAPFERKQPLKVDSSIRSSQRILRTISHRLEKGGSHPMQSEMFTIQTFT